MRILQLSKYYPPAHGGLELVAEFFSRAFRDRGDEVTVLALGRENAVYRGRFGERVLQGREDLKLRSSPFSLSYFREFRRYLQQERPDFVLVHLPHPFAHELVVWAKGLLRGSRTKVVGVYHSDIINQVLLRDAYNLHFSRSLDAYDFFVCSSPNLKRSSAVLAGVPDSRVHVIPFCVVGPGSPAPRPREFRGRFISIGRLVPYKGYDFLVDAFRRLPYELTIVGCGPLAEKLRARAPANVRFTGEVSDDEKARLLEAHDGLIVSSVNRAEAYGMTIVEAFASGVPVVASAVDTGVSFLVRDGETGLMFEIRDEASLRRKLESFAANPDLLRAVSARALDFYHRDLSYGAFRENVHRSF